MFRNPKLYDKITLQSIWNVSTYIAKKFYDETQNAIFHTGGEPMKMMKALGLNKLCWNGLRKKNRCLQFYLVVAT